MSEPENRAVQEHRFCGLARRVSRLLIVCAAVAVLTPSGAAAASPRYDQARRVTIRVAQNVANLYGGGHARFTGCTRTSPRRLVCTYDFEIGSRDLDLTTCFGGVIVQAGARAVRFRAPFPECI